MRWHTGRILLAALALVSAACAPGRIIVPDHTELVDGWCAPGFEPVADEFVRNFQRRGEYGAAVAVYHRGRKVVDLWGGFRDIRTREPWEKGTMVMVFSTTKGAGALCAALARSRGWLDYDAPVSRYWPEFAQNGKEHITVRELLAHEAGLPVLDTKLRTRDLADLDSLGRILARQRPIWPPGTRHGYHAVTLGLYLNEIIRRTDPQGRSIGRVLQEEICGPLDVEFYIGLPDSVPDERIARFSFGPPLSILLRAPPRRLRAFLSPRSLISRAGRIPVDTRRAGRAYCRVEVPSVNGVGTARALARIYSAAVTLDPALGITPTTLQLLSAPTQLPPAGPRDTVAGIDAWYSLGFSKPGDRLWFGSSQRAFGSAGLGGSLAFADPDHDLAFAYTPNRAYLAASVDPRADALIKAVYACLDSL
ncbi:MAG: serine hydrolase domain-containing protein [bacterium]